MTTIAEKYFPSITPRQLHQLSILPALYSEWNDKINVVSRKDIDNFGVNHLLHSLAIARFITFRPGTEIIDVGTGGGLPGIPLAIMFPEVRFTLVDSIAKKIKVVEAIAAAAEITNIKTIAARAENLRGRYHFIIGRAVTDTDQFIRLTRHLASSVSHDEKKNGWILLKGGDLDEELAASGRKAEVIPVSTWFDEPFFVTKKVVYIPF